MLSVRTVVRFFPIIFTLVSIPCTLFQNTYHIQHISRLCELNCEYFAIAYVAPPTVQLTTPPLEITDTIVSEQGELYEDRLPGAYKVLWLDQYRG